ncbi:MAG: prepilin-type N-terminal cleavage/methylation domain-containing protein, partial [Phycisphaerae bacterium]|nr:prepilin-type N-terminal cleavage/methylation domain-containing protein [Phycisphaerae bacterium]
MQASVKQSSRSPRSSGFTLIELLVVIAVLALLLAILSPSFRMVKIVARRLICRSRLAGIAESSIAYASSNKGIYIKARYNEVQICLNPRY